MRFGERKVVISQTAAREWDARIRDKQKRGTQQATQSNENAEGA